MAGRMLLKLEGVQGAAAAPREVRLGAGGPAIRLEPLFGPRAGGGRQRLAAGPSSGTWYVAEPADGTALAADGLHPWDAAHAVIGRGMGGARVVTAEPDLPQTWPWQTPPGEAVLRSAPAAADRCQPAAQDRTPPLQAGNGFGWHLGDDFTGLRAARELVGEAARTITIVHLDTGYDPGHATLPQNLAPRTLHRNFVEGTVSAVDETPASGLLKFRGHGTGTLGLLAGGPADGLVTGGDPVPAGFGAIGGAPLARIVPVRIADSVVHFWTSTVARGIDHARQIGAHVLSMSMGGLPSAAWADAVNAAYEAGVVLVCAAGNSFNGLPTSLIVYPARFGRVIAACGIMAGGHPYYGLDGPMEGCAGPAGKMGTAMAAYTPNVPWAKLGCPRVVDMDGAGTSSATPQIAAAAALWLAHHQGQFAARSWHRVEAVRKALFGTARRPGRDNPDRYVGRGVLRARDALNVVASVSDADYTPPDSADFAFLHLLSSGFGLADGARRPQDRFGPEAIGMFGLELSQLALVSPAAKDLLPDPAAPGDDAASYRRLAENLLDEHAGSDALREFLAWQLARPGGGAAVPDAIGKDPDDWGTGADIPRRRPVPAPATRRLRIFASDPEESASLSTAFINIAGIEVPWEELEPGPVGEYLEVVDVDPASDAAYDPVDLDQPYLLAQDGLVPSEGNPQFHQQMAYAVAMRTIRNFEIALGRRALWAERLPAANPAPAPEGGYVRRLRIYPHALRERNAFYSPDRKALLFGYFANAGHTGTKKIFTVLSHDIVAHETAHALLDGVHRRLRDATNPDVLAFHEAFADIVAIFQHFTFPELLRFEIGRTRGDLQGPSLLSDLARQFGRSLHNQRALRQAIDAGTGRTPEDGALRYYGDATEPHERGAVLVAAVFDAFVAIYQRRTHDLIRIATGGTGVLRPGALHPDLVERLAGTAAETAQRVLTLCIRALDYLPPVDPKFGDYLRAIVTADADHAPDHGVGYRVAFAEAFNKRGIQVDDVTSVSPDALAWQPPDALVQSAALGDFLRTLDLGAYNQNDRRLAFESAKGNAARLHGWLRQNLTAPMAKALGLDFPGPDTGERPHFEVHSVRPALRVTADGEHRTDVVAVITQWRRIRPDLKFRGGCTLILDRDFGAEPIRYAIVRPVWNTARQRRVRDFLDEGGPGPNALYGGEADGPGAEPFAMLHRGFGGRR